MNTRPKPAPAYTHLILECRGCPTDLIDRLPSIRKALRSAAKVCGLHVIQEGMHRFRPHGVTGYVLLSESHISIHTWPEHGFAVVDLLSCVRVEREALKTTFRQLLKPRRVVVRTTKRGAAGAPGR